MAAAGQRSADSAYPCRHRHRLPDETNDALDAYDANDQKLFPYIFLNYMQTHEVELLSGFKTLLGKDLDDRVDRRLTGFMEGTEHEDPLRMRLHKLIEELAKERKSYRDRAERLKKRIAELKKQPQDEAVTAEVEQSQLERQKALGLVREINNRQLLEALTDAGLKMLPNATLSSQAASTEFGQSPGKT